MLPFVGKPRPSRILRSRATRCRGKNARPAHKSSSACGNCRRHIPMLRLQPCSMRKESELAWEARLRSAKSSGFATPITSLLDAPSARRLHLPDSGDMGATPRAPQQTCSMSTSRLLRTGAKLASWRVFVPRLWDHAGLHSPLRSSQHYASQSGGNGSTDVLVMLGNL